MDTSFGVFLTKSHVSIDATIEPLGENVKHWIGLRSTEGTINGRLPPVATLQSMTWTIRQPDARFFSSGAKQSEVTVPGCPSRVAEIVPEATSQIRTIRSALPVARIAPSDENAMFNTAARSDRNVARFVPVATSQSTSVHSRADSIRCR